MSGSLPSVLFKTKCTQSTVVDLFVTHIWNPSNLKLICKDTLSLRSISIRFRVGWRLLAEADSSFLSKRCRIMESRTEETLRQMARCLGLRSSWEEGQWRAECLGSTDFTQSQQNTKTYHHWQHQRQNTKCGRDCHTEPFGLLNLDWRLIKTDILKMKKYHTVLENNLFGRAG